MRKLDYVPIDFNDDFFVDHKLSVELKKIGINVYKLSTKGRDYYRYIFSNVPLSKKQLRDIEQEKA